MKVEIIKPYFDGIGKKLVNAGEIKEVSEQLGNTLIGRGFGKLYQEPAVEEPVVTAVDTDESNTKQTTTKKRTRKKKTSV